MAMTTVRYVKAEDRWEADSEESRERALDLTPLVGTWINTNGETRGIRKVTITSRDAGLIVRPSTGEPAAVKWGEVKAACVYSDNIRSAKAAAFVARYESGGDIQFAGELQVNLSLGLLIVASFEPREDARQSYFAREFFHREANSEPASRSSAETVRDDMAPGAGMRLEAGRYSGEWLNTNESTAGIRRVSFVLDDGWMTMRVFGVGESATSDWGEAEAHLFVDNAGAHGGATFLASYDFGFMETCLHGWIKLGVLVIAKFDRFKDGSGRSNRFSREFFYRSGST